MTLEKEYWNFDIQGRSSIFYKTNIAVTSYNVNKNC